MDAQRSRCNEAEINGRMYRETGSVCKRVLAPGECPPEVQVRTPHPDPELRARGFKIGWVFLAIAPFACLAAVIIRALC